MHSTTPLQILSTRADGHSPFHAVFGVFVPSLNEVVCENVLAKRQEFCRLIVEQSEIKDKATPSPKQQKIRQLIATGFMNSMSTQTLAPDTPSLNNLYRAYLQYLDKRKRLLNDRWDSFNQALQKNPSVIAFIKERAKGCGTDLKAQYTAAFNEDELGLAACIQQACLEQGTTTLKEAYVVYQQPLLPFDYESLDSEIIKDYVAQLKGSRWLSATEMHLLAVVFDVDIFYYHYDIGNPKSKPLYLSCCLANAPQVSVRFNGINHYERIEGLPPLLEMDEKKNYFRSLAPASFEASPPLITDPEAKIRCVLSLEDGRVALGGSRGTLKIWDPSTNKVAHLNYRTDQHIVSLATAGNLLAAVIITEGTAKPNVIHLWDVLALTFEDHTSPDKAPVYNLLSFSSNKLLGVSDDKTIQIWDIALKKFLNPIKNERLFGTYVRAIIKLPGRNRLASTCKKSIVLWRLTDDLQDIKGIVELKGHEQTVNTLALLPRGYLVSSAEDSTIRVWDLKENTCVKILKGNTSQINSLAVLPNGLWVSCSLQDKNIQWWDLSQEAPIKTSEDISVCQFTILPDGRLVSCTEAGVLQSWPLPDTPARELKVALDSKDELREEDLKISDEDENIIIQAPRSCRAALVQLKETLEMIYQDLLADPVMITMPDLQKINIHGLTKTQAAELKYLMRLFFKGESNFFLKEEKYNPQPLKKWLVNLLQEWKQISPRSSGYGRVHSTVKEQPFDNLSSLRQYLFDQLIIDPRFSNFFQAQSNIPFSVQEAKVICSPSLATYTECMVALSDQRIVRGGSGGVLKIWDASTKQDTSVVFDTDCHISALTMAGRLLAVGLVGNERNFEQAYQASTLIKLYDISPGSLPRCVRELTSENPGSIYNLVSLSPDKLMSISDNKTVQLWHSNQGKLLNQIKNELLFGFVRAILQLPESGRLASTARKSIMLWRLVDDLKDITDIVELKGHQQTVNTLTVLPTDHLASGSDDMTIRIWDLKENTCVSILKGHTGPINSLTVFSNGLLASCSLQDQTIRLENLSKKAPVITINGVSVHRLAILPGGRLVSCTEQGVIQGWDFKDTQHVKIMLQFQQELREKDLQIVLGSEEKGIILQTAQPCGAALAQFKEALNIIYQDFLPNPLRITLSNTQLKISGLPVAQAEQLQQLLQLLFRKDKALPGSDIEELITAQLSRIQKAEDENYSRILQNILIEACETGNISDVKFALQLGAQPEKKDEYGKLPLCAAVYSMSMEVIKKLIELIDPQTSPMSSMSWQQVETHNNDHYFRIWKRPPTNFTAEIETVKIISLFSSPKTC